MIEKDPDDNDDEDAARRFVSVIWDRKLIPILSSIFSADYEAEDIVTKKLAVWLVNYMIEHDGETSNDYSFHIYIPRREREEANTENAHSLKCSECIRWAGSSRALAFLQEVRPLYGVDSRASVRARMD